MSADISSPETICLQCGDRGFTNAFVYCVKCLEFAVHRYCLDVIPETVDEFVRWICDDCDVKFQKRPSVPKHNGQCHSTDRTSDHIIGHPEVGTTENNLVAVNNVDEGGPRDADSAPEREPQRENNSNERAHEEGTNIEDGNKLDLQNERSEDRKSESSQNEQCENNSSERLHEEGINIDVSHCAKPVSDSDLRENSNPVMKIDQCETDSDHCTVDKRDKTVLFQLPEENKVNSDNQRSEDRKSEVSEERTSNDLDVSSKIDDYGQCHSIDRTSDQIIGHSEVATMENNLVAVNNVDEGGSHDADSASEKEQECGNNYSERPREEGTDIDDGNKLDLQNQRSEDRKSEVSLKEQCENKSSERLHEEGTNIDVSHCAKSVSDSDFRENNDSAMQIDQCETDSDPCTVDQRDETVILQLPEENKVNSENQRSEDRKSEVSQKEQCENKSSERLHEEGTNIDVSHCAKSVSDSDFRENNDSAMQIDQCETDSDPCTVDQRDKTVIFQLPEENKVDSENQSSEDRKSEVSEEITSNDIDVSSKVDEENKVNSENQRSEDRKSEVSEERTSNDVDVSSKVDDCHILSEPVIMPVWRGSFDIRNRNGGVLDELMAHMSSRACHKVYEEACLFEPVLHLEILPKSDVWPKSFEKSESVENNIALYFFPSDIRNERVYEQLVDEMVQKALAMRAIVQNAELLVFASTELPTLYWRFQGGYYLWGVFRAKQNRAPCSQSYKEELRYNNPVTNADLLEDSTGFSWDMMTTSNPLAIVLDRNRLNGTNYADWKRNLKLVLTLEDLTHVLSEEPPQLPANNATQVVKDAYKSWFDHDLRAKRYILASVEDRFHKQRHSLSTSKDVMSDLKETIILENFIAIQNAMSALTCKMPQGTRVGDHVVKMIGYIDELENLGAEMEKEIKMAPVLFSLPKAFNQFVLNVGKKNCVMTLFEVRDMLQRAKDWIKKDESVAVVVPEAVVGEANKLKTNKKRKRNNSGSKENPKQGSGKKRAKDKDQSKDSCFHCGKKGHWRRNCRDYLASRNN